MTNSAPKPLRIFCSYSHENEEHLDVLRKWLRPLERQGLIEWWHDRDITPGWEWDEAIDKNLRTADVILLLVTYSFMASDYVYEKEIGKAVERHDRGEARVIPIIVRPAHWEWASFGKLQALPKNAKPIVTWPHQDEAWLDVVRGVEKAVKELLLEHQERAANERFAKEKYRNAVAEAWADKKLTNAEAERLSALANELELGTDNAADVEREVMDGTKEAVLQRQKQAAKEERRSRIEATPTQVKVFETSEQTAWLKVTEKGLEYQRDDRQDRSSSSRQWTLTKAQVKRILSRRDFRVNPQFKERSGLFSIGPRKNWIYSKSLYREPSDLKLMIQRLLEKASI